MMYRNGSGSFPRIRWANGVGNADGMSHAASPLLPICCPQSDPARCHFAISSLLHCNHSAPSMRCQRLGLVAITVFLIIIEAASESHINTLHSTTTDWNNIPSNRLLRIHKFENFSKYGAPENEDNNEERVSTSAIETLTSSLKLTDDLDDWLKKGESADDVFKLLTLDNAADDLLSNPNLKSWISYMKLFNERNPTKKTSVIATLTTHYGDDILAKIIEAEKKVPRTESLAKRLQSEQMQHWLGKGKSPDDVFALLKLDKAGTELFAQPQIATWAKYVDDFNNVNPDKQVTLFSTLASHYSDKVLVLMLIAAKKVPSTEKIAVEVQSVQTELWLKAKKKPEEIFRLLQLEQERYNIFSSPVFSDWVHYTDNYRKINYGTKLTTVDTLTKYYDEDVLAYMILEALNNPSTVKMAKRLETEQLRNWYIQGYSPKDVFEALDLYSSGVTVFDNPLYPVWTKYTVYLGAAEPSYKVSELTFLFDIYSEKNLVKVLRAGNNNPSTKKMATELQDELLQVWLRTERDPMDIHDLLWVDRVGPDDPNRLLYIEYVKAYALG